MTKMLNKSKGNMYPWVSATWNVIKGKCPHDCRYCYMKRYPQPELHFDESELKTDLGSGNFIFVGSSCDMWADGIDNAWVATILEHCCQYNDNRYLFQTKNPGRLANFSLKQFPLKVLFGTTIETNRQYELKAKRPDTILRYQVMKRVDFHKMVSIEPIMDFDLDVMVHWIQEIKPQFVSIGADSGNNHLPEPSGDKVKALIEGLKEFTEVKIKDNLKRLLVPNQEGMR